MIGTNKLLALDLLALDPSLFDNLFGSFSNCLGFSLFFYHINCIATWHHSVHCCCVDPNMRDSAAEIPLCWSWVLCVCWFWVHLDCFHRTWCVYFVWFVWRVTAARSWQLHCGPWESTLLLQSRPPKMPFAFCQCIMMEFACWWCIVALIPWAALEPSANYLILTSRSHN
jgi:hypothetical protein